MTFICVSCLSEDEGVATCGCGGCSGAQLRITVQDFLESLNWEKLNQEAEHLRKTAIDYPQHAEYCNAKIARIEKLSQGEK